MRAIKLPRFHRDPDKPTLRERAVGLKAKASRLINRRSEEADPQRRAMMAGGLAAAVAAPLPVFGASVAAAGLHPDQALFDAEAECVRAVEALTTTKTAWNAARDAVRGGIGPCPPELISHPWERSEILGRHFGRTGYIPSEAVWLDGAGPWGWDSVPAWTDSGLHLAIDRAVGVLGQGGRTPHHIRRWRSLLPIATGRAERRAALEARHDLAQLRMALREAEAAVATAKARRSLISAHTVDGLALKVKQFEGFEWQSMPAAWATLLESASLLTGIPIKQPDLDPAALVEAHEAAGGQIRLHAGEWLFSDPVGAAAASEQRAEMRMARERNRLTLQRWLVANRA